MPVSHRERRGLLSAWPSQQRNGHGTHAIAVDQGTIEKAAKGKERRNKGKNDSERFGHCQGTSLTSAIEINVKNSVPKRQGSSHRATKSHSVCQNLGIRSHDPLEAEWSCFFRNRIAAQIAYKKVKDSQELVGDEQFALNTKGMMGAMVLPS